MEEEEEVPAGEGKPAEEEDGEEKVQFNYPLVKFSDMPDELRLEITEMVVSTYEKNPDEYDMAASVIKQTLDEKFGKYWHVLIGQAYGFDINYVPKTLLQLYVAGLLGVTVWKS